MTSRSLHVPLMLALTFSTGIGDAVGYLHLDRVFTGNMTGNVVILGMALAGADDLPIVGPLLALGGFMLGAAIGGLVLKGIPAGWFPRTTVLFGVVGAVLASQAVVLALMPSPGPVAGPAIATTLAAAMGLQAATARHLSVKDVTTVVVTSTITALAADTFGSRSTGILNRRLVAIASICAGAAVGALLLRWDAGAAIALAALLTAGVAVVGHRTIETEVPVQTTQEVR